MFNDIPLGGAKVVNLYGGLDKPAIICYTVKSKDQDNSFVVNFANGGRNEKGFIYNFQCILFIGDTYIRMVLRWSG